MAQRDLKMEAQRPPDAKPPPRRSTREKTEKRPREAPEERAREERVERLARGTRLDEVEQSHVAAHELLELCLARLDPEGWAEAAPLPPCVRRLGGAQHE